MVRESLTDLLWEQEVPGSNPGAPMPHHETPRPRLAAGFRADYASAANPRTFPRTPFRSLLTLVAAALGSATAVSGQSTRTLAETARWLETDGTDMAASSPDLDLTNVRLVGLTASSNLSLSDCRLVITVTDNSGVPGSRTTMEVPLKEVDVAGVRAVVRAEGYLYFIYIPGRYFVRIHAGAPDTYPLLTTTRQGEFRAYLATLPAKDAEAGSMLMGAVVRGAECCEAGAP